MFCSDLKLAAVGYVIISLVVSIENSLDNKHLSSLLFCPVMPSRDGTLWHVTRADMIPAYKRDDRFPFHPLLCRMAKILNGSSHRDVPQATGHSRSIITSELG